MSHLRIQCKTCQRYDKAFILYRYDRMSLSNLVGAGTLEVTQIESFLEAVKAGSFRAAARSLSLSQPSLSTRIQGLEHELRAPLFHRLGRGVRLTEAGEAFLPFAERVLSVMEQGREAVGHVRDAEGGTLTIGTARTIGTYILPLILEQFRRRFPRVSTHIRTGRSSHVLEWVTDGVVDIGLSRGLDYPDVHSLHLYDEEIVLVTYPGHPFAEQGRARIHEVARQPLILYDPGSTYFVLINQACREAGIVPKVEMTLDSIEATKHMIVLGLGVSFLPRSAISSEIERGTLCHIELVSDPRVHLPTHVLVRRAQHYSSAALAFLDVLREIYGCNTSEITAAA